MQTLGEKDTNR